MSPSVGEGRARSARALDDADGRCRPARPARRQRSAIVNGGRPSASAAIGGAIGTAYQRCGGQTASGAAPVARREHVGVGRDRSPGANDCTGLRAATATPRSRRARASAAAHHVLPTSVSVPVTTTNRSGRCPWGRCPDGGVTGWRARAPGSRPARRCARPTARPAAARCPAGPSAAGSRGRAGRDRAARPPRRARAPPSPQDERHDRRRVPGPEPLDVSREAAPASASPSAERTIPQRRERGGGVGRRRRGREDVGPGAVHDELGAARPGRRRTRRATRASSTGCRRAARRRPARSGSGPSTAWASSSTRSAPCRAHSVGQRVDGRRRRRPSRRRCRSRRARAGRPPRSRSSASRCVEVARGGTRRRRRAARRQPSMIDAWFSSSEQIEHVRARRTW